MKKIITIAVSAIFVFVLIECCGNAVMSAIFPNDEYLNTAYWESISAMLIVGAVTAIILGAIAAYRWVPTILCCVRAEKAKSLAEEVYFERKARDEWNRRA